MNVGSSDTGGTYSFFWGGGVHFFPTTVNAVKAFEALLQSFRSVSPRIFNSANNISEIISTDEDLGLWFESSAIIKIHGVSTKYKLYYIFRHANVQRTY